MEYSEKTENWFALETDFAGEIDQYWGDWGVHSEVGKLEAVLVRRPGPEIESVTDPAPWRWLSRMDPGLARAQHDQMTDIYRQHGTSVHYVEEMRPDRPNAMFMRDLVLGTPEGAIVCRPAIAARRGEERYAARALGQLGVPVVRTITGTAVFEGACALWVNRKCVIIGTGVRCNAEGLRQVSEVLRTMGVERIVPFHIPYGHAHIDGLMNMIDHDLAMIFPWQTPYDVWKALRDEGVEVLEAPSVEEIKDGGAVNFVALSPRKLLMAGGNPRTREILEQHDATVIEIDISEIQKGWGGLHCMTAFLKRGG